MGYIQLSQANILRSSRFQRCHSLWCPHSLPKLTRRVMESICTLSVRSAQAIIATGNATVEQSQGALDECDFSGADGCVRRGGEEAMDCVSRSEWGNIQRRPTNTVDKMQLTARESDIEEYVAPCIPAATGSEAHVATVAAMLDDIEPTRAVTIIGRVSSTSSSGGGDSENGKYLDLETDDGFNISQPPACAGEDDDQAMLMAILNSNDECRADVSVIDPSCGTMYGSNDISPEDWLQVAEDVIS